MACWGFKQWIRQNFAFKEIYAFGEDRSKQAKNNIWNVANITGILSTQGSVRTGK